MSRRRNHPAAQRELEDTVHAALQEQGWILPTTPEQVAEAEETLWERAPMADEAEPPAFSELAVDGNADRLSLLAMDDDRARVEETLARAARQGGELSPEIEQAMHRDRDAAEAESEE